MKKIILLLVVALSLSGCAYSYAGSVREAKAVDVEEQTLGALISSLPKWNASGTPDAIFPRGTGENIGLWIKDGNQCLQVDDNGLVSGVGASCADIAPDNLITTSTDMFGNPLSIGSPVVTPSSTASLYIPLDLLAGGSATTTDTHEAGDVYIPSMYLSGEYRTVNDFFKLFTSAGRISGGDITTNDGQTYDVSAGTGVVRIADDDVSQVKFFSWSATSTLDIATGTAEYVGVDYNAGSPLVVTKSTNSWDLDTEFPLGSLTNQSGSLHQNNNYWWVSDGLTNIIERLQADGYVVRDSYVGGLIIGVTGTRNPTLTAGTLWSRLNETSITAKDCSGADTFYAWWRDGAGSWIRGEHASSTYLVTLYDDNNGYLEDLNNNYYANFWVWVDMHNGGELMLIYPQNQYPIVAQAEAEEVPIFPQTWYEHGMFLGRILFKQGQDAPIETQSVFTTMFTAAQATDHGNLAGLTDDDHTQYFALAQNETITGLPTFSGGYLSTASSTVTGTFQVSGAATFGSTGVFADTLTVGPSSGGTINLTNEGYIKAGGVSNALNIMSKGTEAVEINRNEGANLQFYGGGNTPLATFDTSGNLSITGAITAGTWNGTAIDISDYTNLTVSSPITLTDDDIGFDFTTANTWSGLQTFGAGYVSYASSTMTTASATEQFSTPLLQPDSIVNYYGAACSVTNEFVTDVADDGTFQCTALDTTGTWSGAVGSDSDWTAHNSYPAACNAGEYVTSFGDTLSCVDATAEIDSAISTHAGDDDIHHNPVTLAGTPNYLTLSTQEITMTKLDISDDTNATGGVGIDITANDFTLNATEIDAVTWSDGANASNLWTFSVSGTNPTILFGNGGMTFTGKNTSTDDFVIGDDSGTATTTIVIGNDAMTSKGSCLVLRDYDGGGYSYCVVLNGTMTCSQTSCE